MKIFLSIILFSSFSFAKDYKLSKDEFLKRLDEGRITLQKTPVQTLPSKLEGKLDAILMGEKTKYPNFQKEMWYMGYVKSNDFRYFVFYEWFNRGCLYGVVELKKYTKEPSTKNAEQALRDMNSYEKINKKYCEQVLGIFIEEKKK